MVCTLCTPPPPMLSPCPLPTPFPPGSEFLIGILPNNRYDRLCHEKIYIYISQMVCTLCTRLPHALPPASAYPCPPRSEFLIGILPNNRYDRLCHEKIKIKIIFRWCVPCILPRLPFPPPAPCLPLALLREIGWRVEGRGGAGV